MSNSLITPDERTLAAYLAELRSGKPTPGGGSAAVYCGALGASLAAMVCRLTVSRAPEDVSSALTELADSFDTIIDKLSQAARDDEELFARYQAATKLPKDTEVQKRERTKARQHSLRLAAEAPLAAAELAVRALADLPEVARLGTHHALSDVEAGCVLLRASVGASLINVQVNVDMIADESTAFELSRRAIAIQDAATSADAGVRAAIAARAT